MFKEEKKNPNSTQNVPENREENTSQNISQGHHRQRYGKKENH